METGVTQDLISCIQKEFELTPVDIRTYSPLTLAYIGDGVYELIIRTVLVEQEMCIRDSRTAVRSRLFLFLLRKRVADVKRIPLAGFSACGGSLQRHHSIPSQCVPARRAFLLHRRVRRTFLCNEKTGRPVRLPVLKKSRPQDSSPAAGHSVGQHTPVSYTHLSALMSLSSATSTCIPASGRDVRFFGAFFDSSAPQ